MYLYLPGWLQVWAKDKKNLAIRSQENSIKKTFIWNIITSCQFSRSITGPLDLWPWPYNTAVTDCYVNFHWDSYSNINAIEHFLRLMSYKELLKIITHIFFPLTSVDIGFSCWCVSSGHHWSLHPALCISIPSVRSPVVLSPSLPITWGHRF